MANDLKIIQTADGSNTLYSSDIGETYHSTNGAIQESMHVFIEAGFRHVSKTSLRIFEVGFGTGLNALLTWRESEKINVQVHYESIEAFPLVPSYYENLNFDAGHEHMPENALQLLHQCEWGSMIKLSPLFSLCKHRADLTNFRFDSHFDVIYFDAFSPDKQPELWTEVIFSRIHEALNTQGVLVTYCAKGEVRRSLQRVGFQTERLSGPPGKREMLRATRVY